MNSKLGVGVFLLVLGVAMICTSQGHHVGYITSGLGVLRIFQGLRGA